MNRKIISVQALINAPVEKVWKFYTEPKHIIKWNNASDDWYTPKAKNDLKVGGRFLFRMEARDGSAGFDFTGIYNEVKINELIEYSIEDVRKVKITFAKHNHKTFIKIVFEAESINSIEMQRDGWQDILNNFKKYVEEN